MDNPINGKSIVLGVSGSIAAYKAVELASQLKKTGANVDVILTPSAEKLVSALTFQSVTGRKAYTEEDLWKTGEHVIHITLARRADLMVIAPASANTLAKIAHGIADTLLTVTALACRAPLVVAPAMDAGMYDHAATQDNLHTLAERGISILGPEEGHLASGLKGKGRMLEASTLLSSIRFLLSRNNVLAGKKILVTAGGTQEALDPVRFIGNRSSGKQGYAIAQAALDAGAQVTLITAPTALSAPQGAEVVNVVNAAEMHKAVMEKVEHIDAVIMAAAVADFHPINTSDQKIKKESDLQVIDLEPTTDILKELGVYKTQHPELLLIGFAAESENLLQNAGKKLKQKNLDLIVANDISRKDAGFAVDTNEVTLLFKDGNQIKIPLQEKEKIASEIIDILCTLLQS